MRQHLRLALQIDFGVNVGGVDGDVTEPGSNGVDVHAGAKQVRCSCVSNDVRADAFACERWTRGSGLVFYICG